MFVEVAYLHADYSGKLHTMFHKYESEGENTELNFRRVCESLRVSGFTLQDKEPDRLRWISPSAITRITWKRPEKQLNSRPIKDTADSARWDASIDRWPR